ncbi:MAG: THUMP domain-containing protein [Candidatus Thermoplasmatota archaeon]|nr:hypothetical protein [Euryarchaeota archaeon]MEC9090108.1 THUMP domain-containing protein [Candidatus Thermoplasmatota archaeon]MED5486135.1 THUMP domain-containing protein [Candidatus Thermoplasmatota archaeon]|tara:strand:- start:820 stop:1920 length:1101 start_codon:yes stop_codon:yes gene_type:complete
MSKSVVIGAGWHPDLFRKEAAQLIGEYEIIHPHALICDSEKASILIQRSSLISEVLQPGGVVNLENPIESISTSFLKLGIDGRVAVRATRSGERVKGWSSRFIAGEIGGKLVEAGYEIDLTNPEIILRVHLLATTKGFTHPDDFSSEPVIAWGITIHDGDDWAQRKAPMRPFFKPISLDPKLARAMVNFACPNGGRLLDPFCGTGGLLVEGVLCGMDSCGSDLAWPMVVGSRENAQWAVERGGVGHYDVRNGSALNLSETWDNLFDGFAFDPPYGRNAWKSEDGFDLLSGTLKSCHNIAANGAKLVTLIPWPPELIDAPIEQGISFGKSWGDIAEAFSNAGWSIVNTSAIRVHRSLARRLIFSEKK